MTNNDELARNPVLAYADSYRSMAKQGAESVPVWGVITDLERNIAPLYSDLLAERDADKKRIAELNRDVDAANARVDTKCAQLCNQDEEIEMLRLRIAELEARTVSVKLPDSDDYLNKYDDGMSNMAAYENAVRRSIAAADIKLEVGD